MSRIIYGVNPVFEALTHIPKQVTRLLADENRRLKMEELSQLAARAGLGIEWTSRNELTRFCKTQNHQGVACLADNFSYVSLKAFLQRPCDHPRTLLIADQLEDPQNLGGILRAMGAFGADLLVIGKNRSAEITPAAVKVSAGAAGIVPVARENSLGTVVELLKKSGFWVWGLEADGQTPLFDADLTGNVAIVIGSEGKGLSRLVKEHCDGICSIPLSGPITSLNASTAAACALYEIARQRNK